MFQILFTGGLGILGTRKEPRTFSRNAFAGVFMGFSIISTVLGGIIIICFSISTAYYDRHPRSLTIAILILGIIEFAIGIWAAVYLPCTCCNTPAQQGHVLYTASSGFVMTQGLGGVPVAVPMQSNCGMVALQTVTPRVQEGQPQIVLVPVSAAEGNQPQLVQVVPYGTMATHHTDMSPPSYEEAQHATQQNRQGPAKPTSL